VRFKRQQYDINFTDISRIVGSGGMRLELADLSADAHAALLHRAQVRSARDQRDVFA
jgi:hypothetical protein